MVWNHPETPEIACQEKSVDVGLEKKEIHIKYISDIKDMYDEAI